MHDSGISVVPQELREFCTLLIESTVNKQELKYIERLSPVLEAIGELRQDVSAIGAGLVPDAGVRLTEIETKIKPLFDNGQPGLCNSQEGRIKLLEDAAERQKGWRLSRRSLVAVTLGVLTLAATLVGTGLSAYDTLHKQSEAISAGLKAAEDRAREHRENDGETVRLLQSELNDVNKKAGGLQHGVDRNSGQIQGVGNQVGNLDRDMNRPKTHWYKPGAGK
jgi:hypothetical protein